MIDKLIIVHANDIYIYISISITIIRTNSLVAVNYKNCQNYEASGRTQISHKCAQFFLLNFYPNPIILSRVGTLLSMSI